MRRFFIWSALAALIGLILAGVAYWTYWNYHARFQPVTVTRNQAEIQRLLDEASWVSGGGGGEPLYIIGYRDSAAMQRYEREEVPKLRAAGIEARIIVFARPDRDGVTLSTAAERATVAELWLTRDWTLYQRWTATPTANWTAAGIPAADDNLARAAVVDAGRAFITGLTADLREAGLHARYPIIIWDDVGAPDRIDPVPDGAGAPGEPLAWPGDGGPENLPYPTLPPIAPTDETPAPSVTPPPRPAPASPPAPRKAPEAKKSDDTTFF